MWVLSAGEGAKRVDRFGNHFTKQQFISFYGEEAESAWLQTRVAPEFDLLREAACDSRNRASAVKAFVKLVKVIDAQSLSSALGSCLVAAHADVRETARSALVAVASRSERDTNAKRIVISVLSRFALPGELVTSEACPTNEEMQTILSRAVAGTSENRSLDAISYNTLCIERTGYDCDSDCAYAYDDDSSSISYDASPKDLSTYAFSKRTRDRLTSARRSCRSMARLEREIRQNRPWLLHRRNVRGRLAKVTASLHHDDMNLTR